MTDTNSGDWNSGDRNSGYGNSGDWNSGDRNSGYGNSGDRNSGYGNSGYWNSGYGNSGYGNSGYWNSGDRNSGYFCTDEPPVRMFNRETDIDRESIDWPNFFFFDLTEWVSDDKMTDEEKNQNPGWGTVGGYLKAYEYKEAWKRAWDKATQEDRDKVFRLPNFDADIFYEITGINVRQDKEATITVAGREYRVSDVEQALSTLTPVNT